MKNWSTSKRIVLKVLSLFCVVAIVITQIPNMYAAATNTQGSITIDTDTYTLAPNNSYTFKLALVNANASDVTTVSSNPSVASVKESSRRTANGNAEIYYRITGVKASSTPVVISSTAKGATVSVKVTVTNGAKKHGTSHYKTSYFGKTSSSVSGSITIDTDTYTLAPNNRYTFKIAVTNASASDVTTVSSNPSVATVKESSRRTANGKAEIYYCITGVKASSTPAIISGTVKGATVSVKVTVTNGAKKHGTSHYTTSCFGNTPASPSSTAPTPASKPTPTPTPTPISNPTVTSAKATTAVNLRAGPGTNYKIYFTVKTGTVVKVLDTSNANWAKVQTAGGQIGYLCTDWIAFISNNTTTKLTLSDYSGTVPAGKTFYITASTTPSDADVSWSTSNANVAKVTNGFIYAAAPGTAVITASSGGKAASCKVTVAQAEPVKVAYTYPNIAGVNSNVELTAITDTARDAVRFVVDMNDGTTKTVNASTYTQEKSTSTGLADNVTRVWKANISFAKTGIYNVTAYSSKGGTMSSAGVKTTAFISSTQDFTTSSIEKRRTSDQMVDIIGKYEGYSAAVYPDKLAYNIPTIGYGHVIYEGDVFYNNLTQKEATALLRNGINDGSYTTEVNKFIVNNNVKTNQNQFDAMVSFSYNVGAGYWNGTRQFDLKNIMLNGVVPPTTGGGLSATTTVGLNVRSSANSSAPVVAQIGGGTALTVTQISFDQSKKISWYQIKLANGTVGWVSGSYIRFASSVSTVHDLNYVDATQFADELLLWHNAGGKPVVGLLYRRLAEAKVFSFGNYVEATPGNANYKHNTYHYDYPSDLAYCEQ